MSAGIGLATLVFLLFLTLKLAQIGLVASWSWLWVLSPIWIPIGLFVALVVLVAVLRGVVGLWRSIASRNDWRSM